MSLRIANLVIPSRHFADSVRFYRDILGLTVTFESGGWCFLRAGGVQIAIHPAGDEAFAPTGRGIYLDLLCDNLAELRAHLLASGVQLLREWHDPAGQPFLLIADPEGNRLEFYEPPRDKGVVTA